MSDELFSIPEQLSPRLRWLKDHEVRTAYHNSGGEYPNWLAWTRSDDPMEGGVTGEGDTEDEAVTSLAKRMNWLMWTEYAYETKA